MAHSVEDDIFHLETELRNLNVEFNKDKMQLNPNSQNGCLAGHVQPHTTPNTNSLQSQSNATAIETTSVSSSNHLTKNETPLQNKLTAVNRVSNEENGVLTDLSCAQQARNEDCSSVNELAGYFDNLLYIPKKMSPMAEMMYM